jgi:hypothetical protein
MVIWHQSLPKRHVVNIGDKVSEYTRPLSDHIFAVGGVSVVDWVLAGKAVSVGEDVQSS